MLTKPLFPYQEDVVESALAWDGWLIAADMGTGKTPMAIAVAEERLGTGEIDQCMVICPSGLRLQWAQAIAQFTDVPTRQRRLKKESITVPLASHCLVIAGDTERRMKQYVQLFATRPQYVILSYENVMTDWEDVRDIEAGLVVLDEATAIKNPAADRTQAIRELHAPRRLALTGTAVENRPEEIFAIMEWVDPDLLGDAGMFDKAFIKRNKWGRPRKYINLPTLRSKLLKRMSRITIDDPQVAPFMPERRKQTWRVELDERTLETYRAVAEFLADEMEANPASYGSWDVAAHYSGQPDESTPDGRIMSMHLALLMLCCHPDLIRRSARNYALTLAAEQDPDLPRPPQPGSKFAHELVSRGWLEGLDHSPKLDMVAAEVRALLDDDPDTKVIIFSAFRGMLPLLADALADYQSVQYHGEMTGTAKSAAQAAFQQSPDVRLLLASHAGAYGLDLPQASWLINYDLAWSHGKQSQINRRHVRASSQHDLVHIVDVITSGTVEDRKSALVRQKGRVAAAIMDGRGDTSLDAAPVPLLRHLRDFLREAGAVS